MSRPQLHLIREPLGSRWHVCAGGSTFRCSCVWSPRSSAIRTLSCAIDTIRRRYPALGREGTGVVEQDGPNERNLKPWDYVPLIYGASGQRHAAGMGHLDRQGHLGTVSRGDGARGARRQSSRVLCGFDSRRDWAQCTPPTARQSTLLRPSVASLALAWNCDCNRMDILRYVRAPSSRVTRWAQSVCGRATDRTKAHLESNNLLLGGPIIRGIVEGDCVSQRFTHRLVEPWQPR